MPDLRESSDLFETSVRLQSASDAITRLSKGVELTPNDSTSMMWVNQFLSNVSETRYSPAGRLMMQADSARPTFYATVEKLSKRLIEEGITSRADRAAFFSELRNILSEPSLQHSTSRLSLAASFLEEFSRGLLSDFWNSSLPQRSPLMR